MERVYTLLLSMGYPPPVIDWMRQHTPLVIVVLAVLAWLPFLALGWLIWRLVAG